MSNTDASNTTTDRPSFISLGGGEMASERLSLALGRVDAELVRFIRHAVRVRFRDGIGRLVRGFALSFEPLSF